MQLANDRARKALARLGVNPEVVTNPWAKLARMAGEGEQWLDFWREQVQAIPPEAMRYPSLMSEQVRAEVQWYQNAFDSQARTLIALAKATPEEVLARIDQRKADMMADAFTASLQVAGLTTDQAAAVRRDFSRRLVVIADAEAERQALPAPETADDGALVGVVVPSRVT